MHFIFIIIIIYICCCFVGRLQQTVMPCYATNSTTTIAHAHLRPQKMFVVWDFKAAKNMNFYLILFAMLHFVIFFFIFSFFAKLLLFLMLLYKSLRRFNSISKCVASFFYALFIYCQSPRFQQNESKNTLNN